MAYTEAQVRLVITTKLEDISQQMATADALIAYALSDKGLAPVLLDTIGVWLAAHYVAITDPQLEIAQRLDYQSTYQVGELGRGLNSTMWGQQAIALDGSGTLAMMDKTEDMASAQPAAGTVARMEFF
jgi:hypothetical protein